MMLTTTRQRLGQGLLLCLLAGIGLGLTAPPPSSSVVPDAETQASLDHAERLSRAFAWSASRIRPSVVEISTGRRVRTGHPFFQRDAIMTGTGSGLIVDERGYILTNHHVIENVQGIVVSLHDGRKFDAKLVGSDPMADLAVLKIEATDLVAASFAEPEDLSVGQWVLAVGSPFGLEFTVTAGIVSATGRRDLDFSSPNSYENFIQTDAAINPGSSGGPLVNLRGEVVGINTAIQTRDGGYLGIAFAIPVDMTRNVVESIVETGTLVRAYLGVRPVPLNPRIKASLQYKGDHGLVIAGVLAESPAATAGLQRADIITHVNDEPILDMGVFTRSLAFLQPGDRCEITIYRDQTVLKLSATLARHPGHVSTPGQTDHKSWVND